MQTLIVAIDISHRRIMTVTPVSHAYVIRVVLHSQYHSGVIEDFMHVPLASYHVVLVILIGAASVPWLLVVGRDMKVILSIRMVVIDYYLGSPYKTA